MEQGLQRERWAKEVRVPARARFPSPLVPGNINLHNRQIAHNRDGSISTVRSMSIGTDQGEVLIPTVINGRVISEQQAIEHYRKTGEHLGIFRTPDEATAYAKVLHEQQAQEYLPRDSMVPITLGAESGNRDYVNGRPITSAAGAKYAMQTMPSTSRDPGFGVRPARSDSPGEFNRVGREYLSAMMDRYGGDPAKAWAAYNAGPGRVDQALRQGVDWLRALPAETQQYVRNNIQRLRGGQ
jgi:hypothetical protein